jgi:clan AA aspartic protease
MIFGHVRDNFPHVTLTLPGRNGPVNVEFIVDTGFDGELTLPHDVIRELDAVQAMRHPVLFAGGFGSTAPHYKIVFDWNEEERVTEIIELEGKPLLGNALLEGGQLHIDMNDGGEVLIEF